MPRAEKMSMFLRGNMPAQSVADTRQTVFPRGNTRCVTTRPALITSVCPSSLTCCYPNLAYLPLRDQPHPGAALQ